jgi:predicted dehydrogenase
MLYESGMNCSIMSGLSGMLAETRVMLEGGTITVLNHRNPDTVLINGRFMGERRRRSMVKHEYRFPYASSGFQYEAAHVQECLRKGLKASPRVSREESLVIMRICDEVRRQANFKYPFEDKLPGVPG